MIIVIVVIIIILVVFFILFFQNIRKRINLTDLPFECFCIHLPDNTSRYRQIQKSFSKYFPIRFMNAVDTRNNRWKNYVSLLTLDAKKKLENSIDRQKRLEHSELCPGAIGCFLSHVQCWKSSQKPFLLVLEDDATLNYKFQSVFATCINHFPEDADILLLSCIHNGNKTTIHLTASVVLHKMKPISIFYGLYAYIIHKKGIQKLLHIINDAEFRISKQLDSFISDLINANILSCYFLATAICDHKFESPTNIQTIPCC